MTLPPDVRDRIARRFDRSGGPMLEHLTTTQTERGARQAGKRSGQDYRLERAADGRWEVWIVRRGS